MKVLVDFHHDDLFESLRILFEDRLGMEVYRPIGMEWQQEGFWNVYPHPETANQYLGLHLGHDLQVLQANAGKPWLNVGHQEASPGIYFVPARGPNTVHKAITLETFKNTKFDIIVSSIPAHFSSFQNLRGYQPQAKHIFQMGNMWSVPYGVENLLNSTTVIPPTGTNVVWYHQEFSTKRFHPEKITNPRRVANMMHYMHNKGIFDAAKSLLPDWDFKAYGAGNPDGPIEADIVDKTMRSLSFLWHVKSGGEGYGYNIHYAFACGKPVIINMNEMAGYTAGKLLEDGVTCLDVYKHGVQGLAYKMEDMANNYDIISANAYARFRDVVDFDKEFVEIKKFIDRLR